MVRLSSALVTNTHPKTEFDEQARTRATRMSKAQRRMQLLRCALSLSAEKGLGNVNHSELASRAAVSIPTTFHYFPTREILTEEVAVEVSRFLIEDFVEVRIIRPKGITTLSISEMLLAFVAAIDEHSDYILTWMQWSAGVHSATWGHYMEFQSKALRSLKVLLLLGVKDGSVSSSLDCDVASRVILSTAYMLAQMKFSGSSHEEIKRAVYSMVHGYIECQ